MTGHDLQISGTARIGLFGAGAAIRGSLAPQAVAGCPACRESLGGGREFGARHPHIVTVVPQGEVRATIFAAGRKRLADRANSPDMRFRGGKP
jgi:hypothetical protein